MSAAATSCGLALVCTSFSTLPPVIWATSRNGPRARRRHERVARSPEDAHRVGLVVDEPPYERRLADTRLAADEDEAPSLRAGGGKLREEFLALEQFGHVSILRRQAARFKSPLPRLREAQIDLARRRVRPA